MGRTFVCGGKNTALPPKFIFIISYIAQNYKKTATYTKEIARFVLSHNNF